MVKVSIIVPVYNAEKYLEKCLSSFINQTMKEIEIIMVNDGSLDNSVKIIQEYQKKDERIQLIQKENGGQASARNLGLTKATGEYVAFIDSDDYVELDMCEKMYQATKNSYYDIVCSDYYITKNDEDSYYKVFLKKNSGEISAEEYIFSGAAPWMKLYRRSFLINNQFQFPEGIIYEDFASIPTLSKYKPTVYYLSEAYVHYVHHEGSTMRTKEYKKKYEDIFTAVQYLYDHLKGNEVDMELEYLITYHLYLSALNFYQYEKYSQIDKLASFMKKNFPNWQKNPYLKQNSKKEKFLMYLFYHRHYQFIKFCQKLKGKKNESDKKNME